MWNLLRKCVSFVSGRRLYFVILNWLFFGVMLFASFSVRGEPVLLSDKAAYVIAIEGNLPLTVLAIFFSNIVLSAFVMVTLTGFAFFILPVVFLSMRAWLWGVLLNGLSTPQFLMAFPTLILEGEAYVLAALAGVNLGLAWLKPQWIYKEEGLSRLDAVKRALKDCAYAYVLLVVFLSVAAVVETITLIVI